MAKDTDLTQGPVWRALVRVSAPMSLGILGVLMVGLADAFFLARYSEAALTAVGFIYPVIVTLTSLSIGLSAGTASVVSNALGRGEEDGMQRLTGHVLVIGVVAASLVSVAFWLGAPALFGLMGAQDAVLEAVLAYIPWWCLSFPILVVSMSLNSVFRAAGQSGVAATVMVGQAVLNVGFTPLLIFGFGPIPELGAAGAGMATFIARAIVGVAVIAYAFHRGALCRDLKLFQGFLTSARKVVRVAGPASLSNAINPGGMAAVTAAVAVAGDAAVGGFGAATRVQSLLFVPMLALSSGIGPVVGQAWGAGDTDRARAAMRLTALFCLGYGALLVAVLMPGAGIVAGWMTSTDAQAEAAALYLRIVSVGFFGYGILVTANAAMNARDKALWSMSVSAARIALVYIPLAWAGVMLAGYPGVLAATLTANLLGAWGALVACQAVGLLDLRFWPIRAPAEAIQARFDRDAALA